MQRLFRAGAVAAVSHGAFLLAACGETTPPGAPPPGEDETLKTEALEAGAALLQSHAPLAPIDVYLVGFHPMKAEPAHQLESQHYCNQVNQDFAQCVLFDGDGEGARLHGIEFIISESLFDGLPEDERPYWHPHNYEILSGQLVAPGIPAVAEMELMRGKMNSYGKTWHVWNTGSMDGPGDALPLGEAHLAWSFNRDGEARPGLVERRDERLGIDSGELRRERRELEALAHPQSGEDALREAFDNAGSGEAGSGSAPP